MGTLARPSVGDFSEIAGASFEVSNTVPPGECPLTPALSPTAERVLMVESLVREREQRS